MSYVGAALSPRETKKLVLGRGSYIGDLTVPGMLHAAFVRSPHAHARIVRIDADAARRQPGIAAVLTGRDLARLTAPLRIAPADRGAAAHGDADPAGGQGPLRRRSRGLRDRRAALSGRGRLRARRRRRTRRCRPWSIPSEPRMPACRWSTRPFRPIARTTASSPTATSTPRSARPTGSSTVRFHQGRQTHVPMEPRGCLASWLPGDETLTFWHSTQIPHPMRSALAARLGISESAVRVITPDVGGGFGQKIPLYREELATAAASRLLGRPVRWIETRRENLLAVAARPRGHRRRAGGGEGGRHHPRSRRPDPHRLRRVRLLPGELHGARHRHDGARRLSTA